MKQFLRTLLIGVAALSVGPVKAFVVGDLDYYGLGNNECRVVRMVSTAESVDLIIPRSIQFNGIGYNVVEIASGVFSNNTQLKSVSIPSTIPSLPRNSFTGCVNLISCRIEDGDDYIAIHENDFQGCPLSSVYIGRDVGYYVDNVTGEYEPSPFSNISTLENIEFGPEMTFLRTGMFKGCTALEKISIPGGVTEMFDGIFEGCTSLKEIIFEDGDEYMYPYNPNELTFYGCPVEKLYIGRKMGFWYLNDEHTLITNSLFRNMATLTDLQFGPGATDLRFNMFEGCIGLTSVTLPSTVEALYNQCFKGCSNLKKVTVADGEYFIGIWEDAFEETPVESLYMGRNTAHWVYDEMDSGNDVYNGFRNVQTLVDLTFGPLVKLVDLHAFEGCTGLKSLTLPDNIEEVKDYAFKGCSSLEILNLGSGLKTIGTEAFGGCDNLKVVSITAGVPPLAEESTFSEETYTQARLEVYKEAFSLYETTTPWSYFTQIEGVENVGVESVKVAPENVDIFNLQGVCLKRNASQSDIEALSPGLYIIGGKKVIVR